MKTSIFLAAQAQGGGDGFSMLIKKLTIFAIMWFFMIRPQQKRQKEIQNFRNSITRGSRIVTAGGIYGTVKDIDEAANTLKVEIANGICITVDKGSVFASPQATIQ